MVRDALNDHWSKKIDIFLCHRPMSKEFKNYVLQGNGFL